jgi:hypothetical protein
MALAENNIAVFRNGQVYGYKFHVFLLSVAMAFETNINAPIIKGKENSLSA